nr:DUF927 domain-containing protein [Methylobacterium sp. L1A1]
MSQTDVRKVAQVYDEGAQVWYDHYEAPGLEGGTITAVVPREDQDPSAVRRYLLRRGASLPPAAEHRDKLVATIAGDAPVVRRAARTGWREGGAFVSHLHVAGGAQVGAVIPPDCAIVGSTGQLGLSGELAKWQALVSVAQHSTAITVALCAAFAAPLLARVRRPNFALVLVGPSRSGKSTAQLVGASVLGFGAEEHLPSLNATHAGLLSAALTFNDHMLPINEVGTARGAKRDIYVVLRETTYALMNGQDVLRHPSFNSGGATGRTFQVLPILSSEHSPDAWAARNGESRDEGETARLIGVPVLAKGRRTIFDRPPAGLVGDALDTWEGTQFNRLRLGLPQQRGVAFRAYLDALVADADMSRLAQALVSKFERVVGSSSLSPVAQDIVAKFGVIYAGGMLAIRAGVLRLDKREVAQAVKRACQAALAALPDPAAELLASLALLKERLASGAIIDLDTSTRREQRMMRNADGFQRPKGQGVEFVIRAQVFAGWFGTLARVRRLLEWLDDEGLLDHGRERSRERSNHWAQKQVTWPDETRVRSISLYLPAGLSDLDR